VIRIKKTDSKYIASYELTPSSPEPDTSWRDINNKSTRMKPVVDGIKPPKMPKQKKDGLVKWLKTIAGIEKEEPNKKATRRKNVNKKRPKVNKSNQRSNKKNFNTNNSSKPTKPKADANKKISKNPKNKSHGDKKKQVSKKDLDKNISSNTNSRKTSETPKVKKSPIQEIVKKKKVKKDIPLRAKNDPRQSN
jgi:hypothetical protein